MNLLPVQVENVTSATLGFLLTLIQGYLDLSSITSSVVKSLL